MSGEIVNLRQVRKARARSKAKALAECNAASFGRSRSERSRQEAEADLADRRLDAHRREDGPERPA